ncbi:MAG: ribosome-associated translation inhibitor RaiA [Candidatus Moraniibacteriota bacterium]|nr:MAG: ribosome-associated translation inhibitor RaiA [Candidatus Moranbacteria bacterium]
MTRFLSKGVELDARTHDYIEKRLVRIEKLVDPVTQFEVEIDRDKKGKFRVEVMVKTPHNLYRAEDTSESIEGSLDVAIDELEVQLAKNRGKSRDLKRRGLRSIKKKLVVDESARF